MIIKNVQVYLSSCRDPLSIINSPSIGVIRGASFFIKAEDRCSKKSHSAFISTLPILDLRSYNIDPEEADERHTAPTHNVRIFFIIFVEWVVKYNSAKKVFFMILSFRSHLSNNLYIGKQRSESVKYEKLHALCLKCHNISIYLICTCIKS